MKILWAFDPFQTNKEMQIFGKKILSSITDKKDSVTAVYVASNAEAELATAFNVPASKRYSSYPKKLIALSLKKLSLQKIKIEILKEKSLSLTAIVKQITDYTKKKNIDFILIPTNGKKFLPRLVFGSFAESMIHLSTCDLFIYHQQTKFNGTPKCLVYAHDLTPKGTLGLERAISYAKKWNARLAIIHIPIAELGMSTSEFKESTQKKIVKLESFMEKQKVDYQIFLEFDIKSASETIFSMANKVAADVIAVSAQAKKLEAFLGGSTTRQILRESQLPTLVLKV